MKTVATNKNYFSFLEAESIALNFAYEQFYGKGIPVGMAFVFINDRKAGNEWTKEEKQTALDISNKAISSLRRNNLTKLIESGLVPDCAMARRFMSTGSGQTEKGYNY